VLDERWIRSLHVEAMRRTDLHAEREPHVLFQASTIGALLQGSYDGDLSLAELRRHGNLGLGTLNGLDGEMICIDGRFFRADAAGVIDPVKDDAKTPFAVLTRFVPEVDETIEGPLTNADLLAALDALAPPGATSFAVRLDGDFGLVHARSVPRQSPPYRPLVEVIADQHVFDLSAVEGTMIGFRFPSYAEGIEVGGYHLHFISADLKRGGHVLDLRSGSLRARIDPSSELHIELPPGVELDNPALALQTHRALERVEHQG
jgi:acetolactate decarboxylase